jgi:hypothetical protein
VTGACGDVANGSAAPEIGADANGPGDDDACVGVGVGGAAGAGDVTGGGAGIRNVDVSSTEPWSSTGNAVVSPPKPLYPP